MLYSYTNDLIEAGCDEAGRGCLAGPVFAAAVILPRDFHHPKLNDSKKTSQKDRELLRDIIQKEALSYAVQKVSEKKIDQINILKASFLAMHRALDRLSMRPELLLIDGNRFVPYKGLSHICIVEGDAKYASIAAASILAKTYRDDYMLTLSEKFPQYGWKQNKGYATLSHRVALQELGPCVHHRKTFTVKNQTTLPLFND